MTAANDKLRRALEARYGPEKAAMIFARMCGEASGPFAPGNELHDEHVDFATTAGVPPIERVTKKPPTSRPGASSRQQRRI